MRLCRSLGFSLLVLFKPKSSTLKEAATEAEKEKAKRDAEEKEAREKAEKEILKREPKINKALLEKNSRIIGYGAIKYSVLRVSPEKNVVFDWQQALSFEGETAPYIQYAYARISSILKKAKKINQKADFGLLNKKEEQELIKLMSSFTDTITKATCDLRPHLIANYLYQLAQKFNEYYHIHQILKADGKTRDARLLLISSVKQVIKNGLSLLGIEVLEKM